MDYASKEVIQKCGEVRQFAQAFALYLAIQGFVGDISDDAFGAIAERHHSVTEEFAPKFHSVLKRSTATPQDEAYELLFSYKEKMEPVVKMLQVELDNLGSSENIQRQFQEVFVF